MDGGPARNELAARIETYVDTLCGFAPDRHVGSEGNAQANAWLAERFAAAGLTVMRHPFDCVDWEKGAARLTLGGHDFELGVGPYSPSVEVRGAQVVAASSLEQLEALDTARDRILLLHGALTKDQLTPRNYPFYRFDAHTQVLAELDRLQPAGVVALTGANPGAVGALSPFPYAEDADFGYPSAYAHESIGDALLALVGGQGDLLIDSRQVSKTAQQVVATLAGTSPRIVVSAHVDARFGTPGALDNAASVATIVALAEQLATGDWSGPTVDFVPFNGEDNFAAYGEMAYLAQHPDLGDIRCAINLDAAGFRGATTHVSYYGASEDLTGRVEEAMAAWPSIAEGPAWPQSDHMVFAMRGVPAIAITTSELQHVASAYTHTARDVPDLVDSLLLADIVGFLSTLLLGT